MAYATWTRHSSQRPAVHLRGILAAEGTATVGTPATVGVDDNLAPSEAGVAVGTADDKIACRINEKLHFLAKQLLDSRRQAFDGTRKEDFFDVLVNLFLLHVGVVLGGDHNGVDALGLAGIGVLHRYLALGVGAQVTHLTALAADFGEFLQDDVGKGDGQRHQLVGLAAGVAEHHALVAGTLVLLLFATDTLVDVGRLLVDGGEDTAAFGLELVLALGVADFTNDVADSGLHIDIAAAPFGVVAEKLVEEGVGDLVGHLVGMAFGNGFRGEEIAHVTLLLTVNILF